MVQEKTKQRSFSLFERQLEGFKEHPEIKPDEEMRDFWDQRFEEIDKKFSKPLEEF
jgi:hypothetical protein